MTTVDHCLPPTTNTLDPLQRQRLLKSTRKVGALLGTTPRVLEPGMDLLQVLHPSTTRAQRRHGKILYNLPSSASSSRTSLASDSASDNYVWIPASKPALASDKHRKCPSTPITVHFPGKSPASSVFDQTPTKAKTSPCIPTPQKPLSQPILYRMRAKPSPPPIMSPLTSPSLSASALPKLTYASTGSTRRKGGLTEGDKRRKMAKLVRTLGENIPPELVFGGASSIVSPPQRSTSLRKPSDTTSAQPPAGRNHQRPRNKPDEIDDVVIQSPIVFRVTKTVEEYSSVTPTLNSTSSCSPSSTSISASASTASFTPITHPPNPKHRKHRPRSLTLGSIPFKSDQGNIIIQQGDAVTHTPRKNCSFDIPSSTSTACGMGDSTTTTVSIEGNKSNAIEYGRRKEREWSGEWNVKDMREVTKALRGLRLR